MPLRDAIVTSRQGKMPDTVVGRVYVEDPDDWDLPDKTFSWLEGEQYRHFELDTDTGNITMKYGTPNGSYPLKFQVRTGRDKRRDNSTQLIILF